jgi:selenium-binding protein 1
MKRYPVAVTSRASFACAVVLAAMIAVPVALQADETCQSPYMPKITGQEEYLYVWTLGEVGLGDESDKLVTIDVRPGSKTYGKVIHTAPVPGRNEAHHGGFNDDRTRLWLGGLDTSKIFLFDVKSDPSKPKLVKTIDNFVKESGGVVGPHGHYALPGRMVIAGLSNDKDHSGRTALVEYSNEGEYIATHWMPMTDDTYGAKVERVADGYGYDIRVLPRKNIMLTSSFTGWSNYMMDVGKVLQDEEAMRRFGQTVVVWDLHARKPLKVLHVPGSPLEIRFAWGEEHNYAFTATSLTSQLWLVSDLRG